MAGNQQPNGANAAGGQYQDVLTNFCRNNGMRPPNWQAVSDRRGGRTAWSCIVQVQGLQPVQARFWYDGQYVNSAREDAAQVALQRLGQLPQTGVAPGAAGGGGGGGGSNAQQPQPQPHQGQPQQYPPQQQQQQRAAYQQQNQQLHHHHQTQRGQPSRSSQQSRNYGVIGS